MKITRQENTWKEKSGRQTYLAGGWHRKSILNVSWQENGRWKILKGWAEILQFGRKWIKSFVFWKRMRRDEENGRWEAGPEKRGGWNRLWERQNLKFQESRWCCMKTGNESNAELMWEQWELQWQERKSCIKSKNGHSWNRWQQNLKRRVMSVITVN